MTDLTRRAFVAGSSALAVTPVTASIVRAQTVRAVNASWQAVADRTRALEQSRAILVYQNGREVLSAVFRGPSINRLVPIKSVSKTLVAALTGAAMDRGEIPDVTARLGDLAPQLIPRDADKRVGDITVEHLVTMQAGLERTSGPNYGGWVASRNWVSNALSRSFVREPGQGMLYSTGSFHVLGAVLSEVSGRSLLTLARERLGRPLGAEIPAWTRDPQGRYLGGNQMAMTLEGMVRFGEMYRLNGVWDGKQVLSTDWVGRSLQPRTRSPFSGMDYGYGWFLGTLRTPALLRSPTLQQNSAGGERFALARGYGGQLICVLPGLSLTLAITSDPNRPARSAGYFGDLMSLIEGDILSAARGGAS